VDSWSDAAFALDLTIPLALVAGGVALARYAGSVEKRRRIMLSGMLVTIVLFNCVWGAIAVRRTNAGDHELDDLRAGLARVNRVDRVTFVAISPGGKAASIQPPAQLIYVVASLWPQAAMNFAGSWESAMRSAGSDPAPAEPRVAVFIAWSPRGRLRGTAPDTIRKTAAAPFLYQGLEVVAYVRNLDPLPRTEENLESRSSAE